MQVLRKYFLCVLLMISLLISSLAQEFPKDKQKSYNIWVYLKENPDQALKGILFEVKDSAILIVFPLTIQNYVSGKADTSLIQFNQIDRIKIRRQNAILRGGIEGLIAGYAGGFVITYSMAKGAEFAGIIAFYTAFPLALLGGATGLGLGSVKDRIPVKGDAKNFELYRSLLQDYSYVSEKTIPKTIFEHRGFAGATFGYSSPCGGFKKSYTHNGHVYNFESGYGAKVFVNYRFSRLLGLSVYELSGNYTYNPDKDPNYLYGSSNNQTYWSFGSVMVAPILSAPVGKKVYFDFKSGIGYANPYLIINDTTVVDEEGLGFSADASLVYNFSHQWCFTTECGYYFTSKMKFDNNSLARYSAFYLTFGFAYRFSKRGL